MTFAYYSFLFEVPEDMVTSGLDSVRAHVEAAYEERFSHRLDDGNYGDLTSIILDDGRIIALVERKESAHLRLERLSPDPSRWRKALDFAMQCVATDLVMFASTIGRKGSAARISTEQSREELLQMIERDIKPRVSGARMPTKDGKDFDFESYGRWRASQMVACLKAASLKPFTRRQRVVLHEYRAFDLRVRRTGCRLAILQAHLHT